MRRAQAWRGPEDQEDLDSDLSDEDPAVSQILSDYSDDEDLRVAIVTAVSAKNLTAVLASGRWFASMPGPASGSSRPEQQGR